MKTSFPATLVFESNRLGDLYSENSDKEVFTVQKMLDIIKQGEVQVEVIHSLFSHEQSFVVVFKDKNQQ